MIVNMAVIKIFIWMCVSYTLSGEVNAQVESVTACFTPVNCDMYKLGCQDGVIRITETEYRYRIKQRCQLDICENKCCPFDYKDCRGNFSEFHAVTLYQRCSGQKQCGQYRAPQAPPSTCTYDEQYIHMNYTCIKESTIIDICNYMTTKEISEVDIMLNKTRLTDDVSRCICQVKSNRTVLYQLVDIRFFVASTETDDRYNCTSGTLAINGEIIQCNQNGSKNFVYMRSGKFMGKLTQGSNVIQLTYNTNRRPAMVWINLKGSNGTFMLNCSSESTANPPIIKTTPSAKETRPSTPKETIGAKDQTETFPVVFGVTGALIVIIPVAITTLLVYKRKCRKNAEKDTSKKDLPNVAINHAYASFSDSDMSYPATGNSNYDIINDESVLMYSEPVKRKKEYIVVAKDENKFDGNVHTDEYDRIEFGTNCAKMDPHYNRLQSMEGNVHDNTYSHVFSKSKSSPSVSANEYCRVNKKDLPNYDHSNNAKVRNEHLGDEYSHVDFDVELKKEEDPYNHADFGETKRPVENEKDERGEIISSPATGSFALKANAAKKT